MAREPYKRWWSVKAENGRVMRPSRLAAGMTETSRRGRHDLKGAALSLAVRGTTDKARFGFYIARSERICPCCRQRVQAVKLSDSGKARLRMLRMLRAQRNGG